MTPTPLSVPRARLAAAYALWLGSMWLSFSHSTSQPVSHAVFYAVTALPIGAMFITTVQYRWLVGASFYVIGFALSPFMGDYSTLAFLLTAMSLIELPIGYLLLRKWAGEDALSGSSQALVRFLISIGILSLCSLVMAWGVFSALDVPRAHVSAIAVGAAPPARAGARTLLRTKRQVRSRGCPGAPSRGPARDGSISPRLRWPSGCCFFCSFPSRPQPWRYCSCP